MNLSDDMKIPRARIRGTLRCDSPLHIGDGGMLPLDGRDTVEPGSPGVYNSLCVDHGGRPLIPGSTLRGYLRQIGTLHDARLAEAVFGGQRGGEIAKGSLFVFDAGMREPDNTEHLPYVDTERTTAIQSGTALDPRTRTAKAHALFHHEYVPADRIFNLEFILEDTTEREIAFLLACLETWDGSAVAVLGKRKNNGLGRVAWETSSVEAIRLDALAEWLADDRELDTCYRPLSISMPGSPTSAVEASRCCYLLIPQAPILVNEPGLVEPSPAPDTPMPALEFSRDGKGRAILQGSSVKGLVRGWARKIAATLLAEHVSPNMAAELAERYMQRLFGNQDQAGMLRCSTAVAEHTEFHEQQFNAIDRFTGGVAQSMLYRVRGARCDYFQGDIEFADPARLPVGNGWKGLLTFVLRDAMEGDLAIGWGRARGYGRFRAQLVTSEGTMSSWKDACAYLRRCFGESALRNWADELLEELSEMVRAEKARTGAEHER